jgi:hypothetical protein
VIGTTGGLARVKRTGRTRRKVTRTISGGVKGTETGRFSGAHENKANVPKGR